MYTVRISKQKYCTPHTHTCTYTHVHTRTYNSCYSFLSHPVSCFCFSIPSISLSLSLSLCRVCLQCLPFPACTCKPVRTSSVTDSRFLFPAVICWHRDPSHHFGHLCTPLCLTCSASSSCPMELITWVRARKKNGRREESTFSRHVTPRSKVCECNNENTACRQNGINKPYQPHPATNFLFLFVQSTDSNLFM